MAVDTNVLVRAVVRDDKVQAKIAAEWLRNSSLLAVAMSALCELVWVLRRVYGFKATEVADTIRALTSADNVETNRPAVEAGLAMLVRAGILPMACLHTKADVLVRKHLFRSIGWRLRR